MSQIQINSDKHQLDVDFVHDFISQSYWAKGRTKEAMQTCVDHSLNFGVYLNEKQIGYARVVTDYAQFAYLLDLFIDPDYRRNGYSVQLMKHIMECEKLKDVKVWRLATMDAHALYKKFGFGPLAHPENMMELIVK